MKRAVSLYGRLRDAGHGNHLIVDVPSTATAKHVLSAVSAVLGPGQIKGCVVATNDSILSSSSKIPSRGTLALLPPVCGG